MIIIYEYDDIAFSPTLAGAYPVNPIFVSSTSGISAGDTVQILLNDGTLFKTTIKRIPQPGMILINQPLPYFASAGNVVIDLTKSKNVSPPNTEDLT